VKIVDAGDSDVIYADTKRSLANAEQIVRALLDAKAMPYILGDHAIAMATVAAFSDEKPIHIIHLDAHFDFIDERNGVTWGHGAIRTEQSGILNAPGILLQPLIDRFQLPVAGQGRNTVDLTDDHSVSSYDQVLTVCQ